MNRCWNIYMILSVSAFLTCVSCNKDKDTEVNKVSFIAGDKSEQVIYRDFNDISVSRSPREQEGIYYDSEVWGISIEGNWDPEFRVEVGVSGANKDYYSFCYLATLSNWEICLKDDDTIHIKLFDEGDIINTSKNWTGTQNKDFIFADHAFYESDPLNTSYSGMWNNITNGFMAIRSIENSDTTYGWIRIDIINNYDLTVYDCAIQNK
jgi:hypothetical protein